MTELIITEKPSSAKKIAEALSDGKLGKKSTRDKVPYYEITHEGNKIYVVCAVGHLYGLQQTEGKKSKYPMFTIDWVPSGDIRKANSFSKKYLANIKRMAKDAKEFTIATDYDIEGEVIGFNIIKYACKQKDGNRMKFSTLTKDDLIKSYHEKQKTLNWPQAMAGITRHSMDWYFGINLSRALTASIKSVGSFKLMSTGRVQGPALKLVVDKEKEIRKFKPDPYWEIELNGNINDGKINASHKKGKFFENSEAENIFNKCQNEKEAIVSNITKKQFNTAPPTPFDLTSLQIEAYKCINMSPKNTLSTAQELYTGGYISYPRTSSQILPKEIGYQKILKLLSNQKEYQKEVDSLLKSGDLNPNNGKKTDPAHPAIYPTGTFPKFGSDYDKKLYDLIVRRFLATFGDTAIRETVTIKLDCAGEDFQTKGTTTIKKGWFELYGKHVKLKEEELPSIAKNDLCKITNLEKLDKETSPPKRFTESSLIKALEKENLGTKATRAQIIDTLMQRGFIHGKAIEATEIGIRTEETLEKYSPKIVQADLTRHFEEEMENIREGKLESDQVLNEAQKKVTEIINEFNNNLEKIGNELLTANKETRNVMTFVGPCPNCKEGELFIRTGKFGKFIACNKYPDCKTIFSLPQVNVKPMTESNCETCNHPKVQIQKRRKAPQNICINPTCDAKMEDYSLEQKKDMNDIDTGKVTRNCPKCDSPLKLRKSIYGAFLGCSAYPKCRFTEKLESIKPINS